MLWITLAPATSHAGPWTKKWGELYVKLGESLFLSDSFRDGEGRLQEDTAYLGSTTSVYFEVGFPLGLQLAGYLPYTVAENDVNKGFSYLKASGGDALFSLQYTPTFVRLPIPVALKLEFKVPFYDVGEISPNFPAPGDGQLDLTAWLSVGGSLGSIPLYFFGEVGYRHRTEIYIGRGNEIPLGDGFAFFAQVGYDLFKRVIIGLNTGGIIAFEQDGITKSYVTVGPSLYIPVYKGLALEAAFDPVVYANASAPGYGISFGVSYKQ